jgi:hypothetical protein
MEDVINFLKTLLDEDPLIRYPDPESGFMDPGGERSLCWNDGEFPGEQMAESV